MLNVKFLANLMLKLHSFLTGIKKEGLLLQVATFDLWLVWAVRCIPLAPPEPLQGQGQLVSAKCGQNASFPLCLAWRLRTDVK